MGLGRVRCPCGYIMPSMPPIPPGMPPLWPFGSGSAIIASVVIRRPATDAACRSSFSGSDAGRRLGGRSRRCLSGSPWQDAGALSCLPRPLLSCFARDQVAGGWLQVPEGGEPCPHRVLHRRPRFGAEAGRQEMCLTGRYGAPSPSGSPGRAQAVRVPLALRVVDREALEIGKLDEPHHRLGDVAEVSPSVADARIVRHDLAVVLLGGARPGAVGLQQRILPDQPQHPLARHAQPVLHAQPCSDLAIALARPGRAGEVGPDRRQKIGVRLHWLRAAPALRPRARRIFCSLPGG
jgi:hypothetical protein